MTDRELRPVGRYEWEQIIRRARLAAVIAGSSRIGKNGKPTKGGMSGTTFTGIALGWASYANDKGREIWPGDATVAVDLETSIAAVRQVRQALLRLGLLEMVRRRTGTRGDEYRLTIPTDLLDVVEVLTPAQHKLAANRLRDAARGKPTEQRGGSDGQPNKPPSGGPADNPEETPNGALGGPADNPNGYGEPEPGWSDGTTETGSGWSGGTSLGGPADTHTDHDRTSTTTDQPGIDLRTAVAGPRAREAAEDPIFDEGEDNPTHLDPAPRRCEPHGLAGGTRSDGRPACPLCRVAEDQAAGRRRPPPADGPHYGATVIQLRRHAS